jgi:glycosyltransferase involved in cell wall biosynthesis
MTAEVRKKDPDGNTYVEISDPAVMAKTPLVSVRMSTYNHEPYIGRSIEGVLMQETDFPIELIIGEDCSTDGTRRIVMEYQRKRPDIIRVIAWDKNVGSRKNGSMQRELLRGKYVALCEGDDYWTHPKKLQMQVDIMEKDPEIGLVHSGADTFIVETGRLKKWKLRPKNFTNEPDLFSAILRGHYPHIYTCTVCMRNDLYQKVKRDNPDSWAPEFLMGDAQTWREMSRICKFYIIRQSLCQYNWLSESACHTHDCQNAIQSYKSAYLGRLLFVGKYRCSNNIKDEVDKFYNGAFIRLAFEANDRNLAVAASQKLKELGANLTKKEKLILLCFKYVRLKRLVKGVIEVKRKINFLLLRSFKNVWFLL